MRLVMQTPCAGQMSWASMSSGMSTRCQASRASAPWCGMSDHSQLGYSMIWPLFSYLFIFLTTVPSATQSVHIVRSCEMVQGGS